MRMWMVDPKKMCSAHLRGEYVELFMFLGTFKKKKKISGYINNNLVEPLAIPERFEALKQEMLSRGFNAKKPFNFSREILNYLPNDQIHHKINREKALQDLLQRCPKCKTLHQVA